MDQHSLLVYGRKSESGVIKQGKILMQAKSPVWQELHDNSGSLKTEEWQLIVLLRHLLLFLLDTEDNITKICKGIHNRKKIL